MGSESKGSHLSQWIFLAFALAFPVILALPSWIYRACFTRCIPEIGGALYPILGFVFWPAVIIFGCLFFWLLKRAPYGHRLHLVLVGIITFVIGVSFFLLSLISTAFLYVADYSELHIPETETTYYVEQIGLIHDGFGFELYEKHGLFITKIARSDSRWHSVRENGDSVELFPPANSDGFISGDIFIYNVGARTLKRSPF